MPAQEFGKFQLRVNRSVALRLNPIVARELRALIDLPGASWLRGLKSASFSTWLMTFSVAFLSVVGNVPAEGQEKSEVDAETQSASNLDYVLDAIWVKDQSIHEFVELLAALAQVHFTVADGVDQSVRVAVEIVEPKTVRTVLEELEVKYPVKFDMSDPENIRVEPRPALDYVEPPLGSSLRFYRTPEGEEIHEYTAPPNGDPILIYKEPKIGGVSREPVYRVWADHVVWSNSTRSATAAGVVVVEHIDGTRIETVDAYYNHDERKLESPNKATFIGKGSGGMKERVTEKASFRLRSFALQDTLVEETQSQLMHLAGLVSGYNKWLISSASESFFSQSPEFNTLVNEGPGGTANRKVLEQLLSPVRVNDSTPIHLIDSIPTDPYNQNANPPYFHFQFLSAGSHAALGGNDGFLVWSVGPDGMNDIRRKEDLNEALDRTSRFHYSPTNGSFSSGDLIRIRKFPQGGVGN